jgi:hypothetical protein
VVAHPALYQVISEEPHSDAQTCSPPSAA